MKINGKSAAWTPPVGGAYKAKQEAHSIGPRTRGVYPSTPEEMCQMHKFERAIDIFDLQATKETPKRDENEYRRLAMLAAQKGWSMPHNDAFSYSVWIAYWSSYEDYEKDATLGRPVPPHRSA